MVVRWQKSDREQHQWQHKHNRKGPQSTAERSISRAQHNTPEQREHSRAQKSAAQQSTAEHSTAKQSRAEQSRAEQGRAEQSRAQLSRAEQT